MSIKDITLTIMPGMVVWPGDEEVQLYRQQKIEDGANANVSFVGMSVHTGTHVDAPYHFLKEGMTIEQIPVELFVGRTQVIQTPENVAVIDAKVLAKIQFDPGITKILFKTSNSEFWKKSKLEFQTSFVGIAADAAQVLLEKGIKVVGIDYLSIAPYKNSRPTHEILLKAKMLIIEGVNLSNVEPGIYTMYCLPLKLKGSDGAPARVILVEE